MYAFNGALSNSQKKFIRERMVIVNNCEQFHSCMAFTHTTYGANGAIYKDFYSYQQHIATFDCSNGILDVDYYWFDCSASTRTQFSRWLRETGYGVYTEIKRLSNQFAKDLEKMGIPEPTGEVYEYQDSDGDWHRVRFDF